MSKSNQFEFTTQLPIGKKETTTVLITGLYYPNKCDHEGMEFDIEDVWGGHYGENGSFEKVDKLTTLARVAEVYCERLWDKIHEATTAHIEYLTGYKAKEMIQEEKADNTELPDVFGSIAKIVAPFPNPATYKAK